MNEPIKEARKELGALKYVLLKYGQGSKNPCCLDTKEQITEALLQYPVLIDAISEEWLRDRDVIIAYLKGNVQSHRKTSDYYFREQDNKLRAFEHKPEIPLTEEEKQDYRMASSNQDWNAFQRTSWFPYHCYDPEIVQLLIEAPGTYHLCRYTMDMYDEDAMRELIRTVPDVIPYVLTSFKTILKDNRKLSEHVKEKYSLQNDAPWSIQAFAACLELAGTGEDSLNTIEKIVCGMLNDCYNLNFLKESPLIRACFRMLSTDVQRRLAAKKYFLISMMNCEDMDKGLMEEIKKRCPIASNIFPDEYVLKYRLRVKNTDIRTTCNECGRCGQIS